MANYSLILDTKFKPFSYAEMLAPVAAATQAHQAIEEEYGSLAAKANVWKNMANEQTDPIAYNMYMNYSNDLRASADQLLRYGLNASSRKAMLDLKSRYSSEIIPIEVAYKRREDLAAEQRKARLENPTLRYERWARNMSLDDFINDPSLDYGQSYSGALLSKQVSQAVANYAKVITEKGGLESLGLPFQYTQDIRRGARPEQVLAVISQAAKDGEPGAMTFLRNVRDQVINSSGIREWADDRTMKELISFANLGLYDAIGAVETKNYTDSYSMQRQLDIDKETRAQEAAHRAQVERDYRNNTTRLYSQTDIARENQSTINTLNEWKRKGYLNSNGRITPVGWEALKKQISYNFFMNNRGETRLNAASIAQGYIGRDEDFYDWAMQHGLKYIQPRYESYKNAYGQSQTRLVDPQLLSTGQDNIGNYYVTTRERIKNGELATGVANIDVVRVRVSSGESAQQNLIDLIVSANTPIYEVGSLQDSGELRKGDIISAKNFEEEVKNNPIKHLINNPVGDQQLVELKNGRRFFIPVSVFGTELVDPEDRGGDLDKANALIRSSEPGSYDQMTGVSQSSSYLSSIMDYAEGQGLDYHGSVTERERP